MSRRISRAIIVSVMLLLALVLGQGMASAASLNVEYLTGSGSYANPEDYSATEFQSGNVTVENVGDKIVVGVVARDVQDLAGADFRLEFDPEVLQAVSGETGNDAAQFAPVGLNGYFGANMVDNTIGEAWFSCALGSGVLSGNCVIAVLTFEVQKVDGSNIYFKEDGSNEDDVSPTLLNDKVELIELSLNNLTINGGKETSTPEDNSNNPSVSPTPVPVASFTSTAKTDATATFGWTTAAGAVSVVIQKSPTGQNNWTAAAGGTIAPGAATVTVTGLAAATAYDFRLVVTGGANAGNSNVVTLTTSEATVQPSGNTGTGTVTSGGGGTQQVTQPVVTTSSLADIQGHWATGEIQTAVARGIVMGYAEDNTFRPQNNISRAEFVTILVRALNINGGTEINFSDVSQGVWFEQYVKSAAAAGIVKGDGNIFRPNDQINRAEIVTMLSRVPGGKQVQAGVAAFADAGEIPAWAQGAVAVAIQDNLVRGYPDNTFKPGAPATRAEAIVLILRLLGARGL